jgi:hypothetical protein
MRIAMEVYARQPQVVAQVSELPPPAAVVPAPQGPTAAERASGSKVEVDGDEVWTHYIELFFADRAGLAETRVASYKSAFAEWGIAARLDGKSTNQITSAHVRLLADHLRDRKSFRASHWHGIRRRERDSPGVALLPRTGRKPGHSESQMGHTDAVRSLTGGDAIFRGGTGARPFARVKAMTGAL